MALLPFHMFTRRSPATYSLSVIPGAEVFQFLFIANMAPLCLLIILRADLCSHCPVGTSHWEFPCLSTNWSTPSAVAQLAFSPAQEARFAPYTLGKTATTRCLGSSKPSTSPPVWVTLQLQLPWEAMLRGFVLFLLPSQGQLLVCSVSDFLVPLLASPPSQKFSFFWHHQHLPSLSLEVFQSGHCQSHLWACFPPFLFA